MSAKYKRVQRLQFSSNFLFKAKQLGYEIGGNERRKTISYSVLQGLYFSLLRNLHVFSELGSKLRAALKTCNNKLFDEAKLGFNLPFPNGYKNI